MQRAVQSELDQFFAHLQNRADSVRVVSAQAFSKARYKIKSSVFHAINRKLLSLIEAEIDTPRWNGLRVVAADGSKVRLTVMIDEVRSVVDGIVFGLFLPGIELFLDLTLHEPVCDERQMLFEVLDLLKPDDLLVLDRGFPCRWLVAALTHRKIQFCMRCDSSQGFRVVREFLRSGLPEQIVTLRAPSVADATDYECPAQPTPVRLVRVVTPSGQVHVVMTSLFDQTLYPASAFADLYHGRWRIEEAFKRLKHRLGLEHTSGLSWHAARQDVGAKTVCDNLNALAAYLATEHHLDPDSLYKINRSLAFDKVRRQIGRWFLRSGATPSRIRALFKELAANLQRLVPLRSQPRRPRKKPHKYFAYKPV